MSSIFTRIINGEIPCHKLREDERFLAFLDIHPINPGHALVVPKAEVDELFDLEDADLGGLLPFARPVARAIRQVVPCARVGLLVAGLEVPHAHLHLVPFTDMGELSFSRARPGDPEALVALAEQIRARL